MQTLCHRRSLSWKKSIEEKDELQSKYFQLHREMEECLVKKENQKVIY